MTRLVANPTLFRILAILPGHNDAIPHNGYAHKDKSCSLRALVGTIRLPGRDYATYHLKDGRFGVSCFAMEDHDGKKT